jgi:hydroxyethylthiazole kinase-like uncharacterized protein yjeF
MNPTPWSRRVVDQVAVDAAWLAAHPLPQHDNDVDKNGRGRVLLIGGSRRVPGAMLLTADAAFRAGAGKVTIATIASAAFPLGIACPSCAVLALPETDEGEISVTSMALLEGELAGFDAIAFGPAMLDAPAVSALLAAMLPLLPDDTFLLLDAFALRAAPDHASAILARGGRTVLTPNCDELAALLETEADEVTADPLDALVEAGRRFGATVMVKGSTTHLIADEDCLACEGGGIGLAMSGSGDVLAGLIAGLGSRGLSPLEAAAWGVWLHGEAGRSLSESKGPVGYMAAELGPLVPALMHRTKHG